VGHGEPCRAIGHEIAWHCHGEVLLRHIIRRVGRRELGIVGARVEGGAEVFGWDTPAARSQSKLPGSPSECPAFIFQCGSKHGRIWLDAYGTDGLHYKILTRLDFLVGEWIPNVDGLRERTDGERGESYERRELHWIGRCGGRGRTRRAKQPEET
jgi:hypothetical protein